jgi:hypothetical protein
LIFNEWLMNWDNKQDHKILLLIDNCAGHIVNSSLKPIKVVFLPTNTSLIQPCDEIYVLESWKIWRVCRK